MAEESFIFSLLYSQISPDNLMLLLILAEILIKLIATISESITAQMSMEAFLSRFCIQEGNMIIYY